MMRVLIVIAVSLLGFAGSTRAQGMARLEATPVFQSEGINPIAFSVTCATATWTLAVASDTISRSTFLESVSSNTYQICLLPVVYGVMPTVAISSQCTTATKGIELTPNSAYTDYSHAGWACASSSGTASGTIKGVRTRDRGDYGGIGDPQLQR